MFRLWHCALRVMLKAATLLVRDGNRDQPQPTSTTVMETGVPRPCVGRNLLPACFETGKDLLLDRVQRLEIRRVLASSRHHEVESLYIPIHKAP
jgi:hypothetical protein